MEKWLELECVDLRGIPERERESFVESQEVVVMTTLQVRPKV